MADTPERIDVPQTQPDVSGNAPVVQEVPQAPEITPAMSEQGVEQTGTGAPPPQVTVPQQPQQPTATSTASDVTTITIPVSQQQLMDWAKGPDDASVTWLAKFWIRMIKKAVKYGWHLIIPPSPIQTVPQGSVVQSG